jgi:hypothetical protein
MLACMQKALDAPLVEVREEINRHVSAPTWGPRRARGITSCKSCGIIRASRYPHDARGYHAGEKK